MSVQHLIRRTTLALQLTDRDVIRFRTICLSMSLSQAAPAPAEGDGRDATLAAEICDRPASAPVQWLTLLLAVVDGGDASCGIGSLALVDVVGVTVTGAVPCSSTVRSWPSLS